MRLSQGSAGELVMIFHSQHRPHSDRAQADHDGGAHHGDGHGSQEAEAGLQRRRSRPSGRAVAVTVVGAAVVVCLSAIGVWSVL